MAKGNGGPAFPTQDHEEYEESENRNISWQHGDYQGMSLRDYFAGQALAGMATDYIPGRIVKSGPAAGQTEGEILARRAYDLADAMLAAREENDE